MEEICDKTDDVWKFVWNHWKLSTNVRRMGNRYTKPKLAFRLVNLKKKSYVALGSTKNCGKKRVCSCFKPSFHLCDTNALLGF